MRLWVVASSDRYDGGYSILREQYRQLSSLGRPLDPKYPSNLFILIFATAGFIAFFVFKLLGGEPALGSLGYGVRSALAIFLAWALGRELDPDYPLSANVSAVGSAIWVGWHGVPSLLLAVWALFVFRIVSRSTGKRATTLDAGLLMMVTGVGVWFGHHSFWILAVMTSGAFCGDAVLSNPARKQLFPGAIMALFTAVFLFLNPLEIPHLNDTLPFYGAALGTALSFTVVIYDSGKINSVADLGASTLSSARIRFTQVLALLAALFFALWAGQRGLHISAILWLVIAAATSVHLFGKVLSTYRR